MVEWLGTPTAAPTLARRVHGGRGAVHVGETSAPANIGGCFHAMGPRRSQLLQAAKKGSGLRTLSRPPLQPSGTPSLTGLVVTSK